MTEYFEVEARDGPARAGRLRLADPLGTPALVTDADDDLGAPGGEPAPVVRDLGSRWVAEHPTDAADLPDPDAARLTVLPHRSLPSGTDREVEAAFADPAPAYSGPSAAVVSPGTAATVAPDPAMATGAIAPDEGHPDAYVLANAPAYVGHAAAFVDAIVETRTALPADTALYLPGVATPANVATLVGAGADLVDPHLAVVRGTQGWYLTADGETRLQDLTELPCACETCLDAAGPDALSPADCAAHNVAALRAALATARTHLQRGTLRDYLEGQARHENWLTATLRRFDQAWTHVAERTPVRRRATMRAATADSLRRVEIQRFADRVTSRYRRRLDAPLVLVPCSARKPYSQSQSHEQYHDAIGFRGHVVSMTSPIGVVPQELELTYPAQHYDSVVTGHWSATEREFVTDVLAAYLERAAYDEVVAHVPPEGYVDIVEDAAAAADAVDAEAVAYTVADHPTTEASLSNLASALAGHQTYRKSTREHATIRAIADYQFGDGAGDAVFPELTTRGRLPQLRAHDADGTQLAAVAPQYGLLSFTLAGARQWAASDAPTHRVTIDDFVPHGSVLAPGVTDADDAIRPGDEVVVEGPSAFGVGRAEMHGAAMRESTRGVAVSVRHVDER